MAKTILLIHGRSFKPKKNELRSLWVDALRSGIERDHPQSVGSFDNANKELIYYGDSSNRFLKRALNKPVPNDVAKRRETLNKLKTYSKSDFSKKSLYEELPGQDWKKEAFADAFGGIFSFVRLSDLVINQFAPDMREYWNPDSQFGSDIRFPMIAPLKKAMDNNHEICVIAHSLGTMISYDTFWKFSRTGEYRPKYSNKKIDLWVTLGSPLGDETVKRKLKGASLRGARKYPSNINRWINVAAEDDYISHDQKVADDFAEMKRLRLVRRIEDKRVYNLAVRGRKSNPHHGAGYLIHPVVAKAVSDFLS